MNEVMASELMETEAPSVDMAAVEQAAKYFAVSVKIADSMCQASLIPEHLRMKKVEGAWENLTKEEIHANCVLVVNQAFRWGVDPFAIMPSTFVIAGKLGFEGKLIAAVLNKSPEVKGTLDCEYHGEGNSRAVTIIGTLRNESTPRSLTVKLSEAKTENEIWTKDPDQKLFYTGAVRWARRHCPQVLFGIASDDTPEIETIDAVAEPTGRIEDRKRSDAAKMDLIEQSFKRFLQQIADAKTTAEIRDVGDKINAELAMPEDKKQVLRKEWGERHAVLRQEAYSEACKRWLKSIETEANHTKLIDVAAEMDADETLTSDEKEFLTKVVKRCVDNLEPQPA